MATMADHDPATVELVASVLRSYVGDCDWTPHAGRAVLDALTADGWARTPAARIVAEHWRDAAAEHGWAATGHALAMVLTALGGETDPTCLGIPTGHPDADRIRRALTGGTDG
jgi:hypothetical protein